MPSRHAVNASLSPSRRRRQPKTDWEFLCAILGLLLPLPNISFRSLRRGALTTLRHAATYTAVIATATAGLPMSQAAEVFWDADGTAGAPTGGSGTWDLTNPLWNNGGTLMTWSNAAGDTAVFGGDPGTVTLGAGVTAAGLDFRVGGYQLTGGTLTLDAIGGGAIKVAAASRVTIDSQIDGSSGLVKLGNGTLVLTNASNTYTGDTVINAGSLVISNEGALGLGTSVVSVNGLANTGNPGFSGGSLVLYGGATGMTLNRNVSVNGRGAGAVNLSGGLVSVGSNTIAGNLVVGGTSSEGRILATHGNTTVSGNVRLGTSGATGLHGNGNWIISGVVSGIDTLGDRFFKSGNVIGTTLWLQNTNNNFAQPLRIDSGTVRVTSVGALGASVTSQAVDINSGVLELRTASLDYSSRNVRKRGNGGGILVDHAMETYDVGQTVTFGGLSLDANADFNLSGRNGYGLVIRGFADAGATINWSNGGTGNIRNVSSGWLTIDADINRLSETSARAFTFGANGGDSDILFTGSLRQTGTGAVTLNKLGRGKLIIGGDASTYAGNTNLREGTLSISSFGALGVGATINIGGQGGTSLPAESVTATLEYTGAGESTDKVVNLRGTTGGATILANGAGAITFTSNFTATGQSAAGAKTLTLGGANTGDNTIAGAIVDNTTFGGATSVMKIGSGTWALSGENAYTGTTRVTQGTLKINDTFSGASRNVLTDASQINFNVNPYNQAAGGTLEYNGAAGAASFELVGDLVLTAGAATVRTAASGGGTVQLGFASLGTRTAGATIDFRPTAADEIGFLAPPVLNDGIFSGYATYNGVDWVGAPGTFVEQFTGYTPLLATGNLATDNALSTGDLGVTGAMTINSLKLAGAQTLTLGGLLTVDAGGVLFDNTNGAATITGGSLGAAATEVIVTTNGTTPGNALTISSLISGTTGQLTKAGSGTLILTGTNAFTGSVHINDGTVRMSGATAQIGASQAAATVMNLRQGATFDVNGAGANFTLYTGGPVLPAIAVGPLNGAGTVTNGGGGTGAAAAIILGTTTTNTNVAFTGILQDGAGPLSVVVRRSTTNAQALTGLNTYTGATVLAAGNLHVTNLADIGDASSIGRGDDTSDATNAASLVFAGGTLAYTGATATIFQDAQTPSVSINRLFTMAGNGVISSEGSRGNNVMAGRTANHAALVFNNPAPIAFSGSGNRTLTLTGDSIGDNALALQLVDNPNTGIFALTKSGGSLWILNPAVANTYSGATTISGGALRAEDGVGLSTNSNLLLNGGVFQSSGTFGRMVGNGPSQVNWAANGNGGLAASTAKLTVTLGSSGLVWGQTPGFVGAGTLILNSNTSLADIDFTNDFEVLPGLAKSLTLTTATTTTTVTITGGGNTTGLTVGQLITGNPNIPAGAYVSGIISATQFSLNVTPTGAGTGIASEIAAGGYRQIQVDDNSSTGLDFATVSGVISGAGGIAKSGAGTLILGDANTYGGGTLLRDGSTFATSIGSAGATATSFGTNVGGGPVVVGNPGTTTTVNLMYVGPGEVATREVQIGGTTGTRRIDSSGAGALVLTNLTNATAGAKTLEIRGTNTDGNMITSVLANNGGTFTLSKFDGGVWILNPTSANTFTGTLTAGGGLLGLTADGIGSAAGITMSNGGIFGYGGPLTITQNILLGTNTSNVFAGSNGITIDGTLTKASGANDQTISNNLEDGAILTINGNFVNSQTAAATRIINWRGYGSTVYNGVIQNNSATSLTRFDIRIANGASFTLNGANTLTGGITLAQGNLVVGNVGALGPATNPLVMSGGVLSATVDLSGANRLMNPLTLNVDPAKFVGANNIEFGGTVTNSAGNRMIVNNLDAGNTLELSGTLNLSNDATGRTTIFTGAGATVVSGVIANGGAGAGGLLYSGVGTGTLQLTGTNTATGALTVNGALTIGGANGSWNTGTTTINGGGVLTLDNSALSGGENAAGRLNNTGTVTLNGGMLNFVGDADGSAEAMGQLTVNNLLGRIQMSGAGSNTLTFSAVSFPNTGSSIDLSSIAGLGTTNKVLFTNAAGLTTTGGLLTRVVLAGDFAAYDPTNGIVTFNSYVTDDLNGGAATTTHELTAGAALTAGRTINALKLEGNGIAVGGVGRTLVLTAGKLLSTGGDNSIDVRILSLPNSGYVQVEGSDTLAMNSVVTGGALSKTGSGTLTLNARNFYNSTTNLAEGTIVLNGGRNTIMPIAQVLNVGVGATFDLNGNVQYVGNLAASGTLPGTAGTVTSTTGVGTLVTTGGGTFAGNLTGTLNLVRIGAGTLTLASASDFVGAALLYGGTTTLENDAALTGLTTLEINHATLSLSNNSSLQTTVNNRINDAAPITMRGGTITVTSRASEAVDEAFGTLAIAQGANTISGNVSLSSGGGTFASADLTFASLTRAAGTTLNFTGSSLGSIGNTTHIYFTSPLTPLANGALGAWAIANSSDYAAYNSVNGVGLVGNGGYVGYDPDFGSNKITNLNVVAPGGTQLAGGTTTTGLLRVSGAFQNDITFTDGGDVLNLQLGGLLRSANNNSTSIGTAAVRGVLTAGGDATSGVTELVIYNAATGTQNFTGDAGGSTTAGSNVLTLTSTIGLMPGMTLTNANLPAGSYIVSVDGPTQVTISQNATAGGVAGTFVGGISNVIVNSVIADNGLGNAVQLIKSGAGALNLSADNTYTGGTIVNQGVLNLVGSGVVLPAGGLTITNATVAMLTNAGQIDAANDVTINGGGVLTLVGANTLASIAFNNNGGSGTPTVNVGGTLTLTGATPLSVTTNVASLVPVINGGTLNLGTGTKTIDVGSISAGGEYYGDMHSSLSITSVVTGGGLTLNKTGDGLLQLSGQSTFDGGVNVSAGGIILAANSAAATLAGGLVSGPLGTGALTMADATRLLVDNNDRSVANAVTFDGASVGFSNVGGTLRTLNLNGRLTFADVATTGTVIDVESPWLNVALNGRITNAAAITGIGGAPGVGKLTKTGLGGITAINLTGIGAGVPITLDSTNGAFAFLHDGDGTSGFETLNLGDVTFDSPTGTLALTVNRAGTDAYYATAANKIISPASFTSPQLPNGLTLSNLNGYGLRIESDITLSATNVFSVANATTSLQTPGLILAGQLSGAGLTKAGNGVLALTSNDNDFTGDVNVQAGTVAISGDEQLGAAGNAVNLISSPNGSTSTLRVTADVGTSRTIHLAVGGTGTTIRAIEVTRGNTFTLNSAFTFADATLGLRKNNLGTLVLTQPQPGWDGVLTIGQGIVRITDGAALGTTTGNVFLNNVSATLELPGGVTVADAIRIASTNNSSSNGVNSLGAVWSSAGVNTINGQITIDTTTTDSQSRSGSLTAASGSTLNVAGGIVLGIGTAGSNRDNWIAFGGAGTINLTNLGVTHTGNLANGIATLVKFGSGTLNIDVASAFTGQRVVVKSGTLQLSGAGTLGVPGTGGGTGDVYLNPTGLLVLDNGAGSVDNRLSGRNLNISGGGSLSISGDDAAATNETVAAFTLREGASVFTFSADAAQQLNFTTGAITRSVGSTLLVRGSNLGDAAANGVATMRGGNYAFVGQLGGTGMTNKSILGWAVGDTSLTGNGASLLTADSADAGLNTGANFLRPLAPAEQTTDFGTANANVDLSTTEYLASTMTINSLRLDAGGGVNLLYVPLSIDSGAVLALAGNTGIDGFSGASYITSPTAARELIFYTAGDLTLNVPIAGVTGGVTKSGAGTLTLTGRNGGHTQVTVNEGTLKLGGGDQTILPGRNFFVNAGGTLDLNGAIQVVNILESRQSAALARNDIHFGGGTVINTGAAQAVLAMTTASSVFAGSIGNGNAAQSNIAVVRSTAAGATTDWNLYAPQTYTGPTLYNGGRVVLNDGASLDATTSLELSNATLLISANNNSTDPTNLTNRINDAATILLRGAMLQFRARAGLITTESLGAVTTAQGNSVIDFAEGGTVLAQSDVTFASFARQAGSRATVRFLNIDATPNDDQRLFVSVLNGTATTSVGAGLTNDLIGGWAVFEREFASYTPGQGVGGLTTVGFAGYSPLTINAGGATDNVRIVLPNGGLTTTLTGDRTLNSFNMQAPTASTADSTLDLGGFTLTLASGGLILSPISTTASSNNMFVVNGNLTAGTTAAPADLYLHALSWFNGQADNTGNADVTMGANIVDNAAGGSVSLVIAANTARGTLAGTNELFLTGNNTYTGGTWVNSGTVRLANLLADGTTIFAVPGDLTIAGGYSHNASIFIDRNTTVFLQASSQINNAATLTLMGGATLDLNNFNQTLAGLNFNNHGGTTPTINMGTGTLTFSGTTINAVGQNLGSTSTINGRLTLLAATTTFNVAPVEWNGAELNPLLANLSVSAVVTGENLVKTGAGILQLNAANVLLGGFDLQAGGIAIGNNAAFGGAPLTLGDDTFFLGTAARTVANAYTMNGDFALRGVNNVTMTGIGTLAAGDHAVSVDYTNVVLSLGALNGPGASLDKRGDGILLLTIAGNYDGATTVTDGILRYGIVNAVPTTSAVTVRQQGVLDITAGGAVVTVGSIAGDSAAAGGVIYSGLTTGAITFTAGGDGTSTAFGGTIANATGSTLDFVKIGGGTLTLGGVNLYNGSTTIADGRLVVRPVVGGSALGLTTALNFGGAGTSGILQLGDASTPLNQTITSLNTLGGTLNAIVSGNAAASTVTFDLATTSTFAGNLGGAGANENNLNIVKTGAGDLVVAGTGTSMFNGTTTVDAGKLFFDTAGAFSATSAGMTLADNTEVALRGAINSAHVVYGFSGAGNKMTVGAATGATLGFSLNGGFNTRLNLAAGQTMTVNGSLTTAIYVNGAPISGQAYVLINGTDVNSLHAGGGTFDLNPVIFNGGSFTYALSFGSNVGGATGQDQWILTPTAVPAAADVWWKGDLTGLGTGVWSATTTTGPGFPSNWDTTQAGGVDALVPPDAGSIVHFSANGATNFNTTLGANLTIQELIFHSGNPVTTIGSSNGSNTLTIGNGVDTAGLTIEPGAQSVSISAAAAVGMSQNWTIWDSINTLTLAGGFDGAGTLTVNAPVGATGSVLISGSSSAFAGTFNMQAGTLIFDGVGSLSTAADVVLGGPSTFAVMRVGDTTAATDVVIGGLTNGVINGNRVVGGNAALSTLSLGPATGTATFGGAIGGAGDENQLSLIKTGAGTQVLDGAISYVGPTIVRNGTLQLGPAATFTSTGTLTVVAQAGATATFDINGKNVTGTGDLVLGGLGAGAAARLADTNPTKGTYTLGGNIIFDAANAPDGAIISANLSGNGGNRTITVNNSIADLVDLALNGTYTTTTDNNLTIAGAGSGAINGNIVLNTSATGNGASNDLNFNSTGIWTINAKIEVDDDIFINTGTINATVGESLDALDDVIIDGTSSPDSVIVNITSTAQVHTGNEFYIRNGGTVNVLSSGGIGTGTGNLLVGDAASATIAAAGVLNLLNADISPGVLTLGGTSGNLGFINGSGTITTTSTKALSNGTIAAGITLAGNGAITKNTVGTVTFSGERAAASTGAFNLQEGTLILDYSTNNNSKIGGVFTAGLNTGGNRRTLVIDGSSTAATTQSVASTTIIAGQTTIDVNNGVGQTATLNLGAITRTAFGGLLAFDLSSSDAHVTTTSPAGTLGWATYTQGGGPTRLAAISGGEIVAAATLATNDVGQWNIGDDVVVTAPLIAALNDCSSVSSLAFAGTGASTLTIDADALLTIASGAIIVDSSVGAFTTAINGGQLRGATSGVLGELIFYQDNTSGSLDIGAKIVDLSGLTKTGAGVVNLTGDVNFLRSGGLIHVEQGILRLGSSNTLTRAGNLLIRVGATFDINGNSVVMGNIATNTTGTIALGGGSLTVTQTAGTTFSGQLTGTAAATFTLNSPNLNFNANVANTTYLGTVVVNTGLLMLSGGGTLANAAGFVLNKSATLLLDNNSATRTGARINDNATITLNSADGAFAGETRPRGLGMRTDQNTTSNTSETVGVVTFNSGANYVFVDSSGGASSRVTLTAADFVRNNNATLAVRGRNLGDTNGAAAWSQFEINADAVETAFMTANLIGGGGVAGGTAKNVSIVPWAIGERYTVAGLGDANMGNSLVTYVLNSGFTALNFNEYNTYAAAGATDNVREVFTADLAGLAGKTINSLVLHNNSTTASTLSVTGDGGLLTNTSGTFLFTLNTAAVASSAHSVTLGGYDLGIQTGATNAYTFFVVNPSSAGTTATLTAAVSSPLNTTAASLTKSGRGTLVLSGTNTYGGGTFLNEGVLQIAAPENIGTGGLTFAGGTLRPTTGITFGGIDFAVLSGGGTVDVGANPIVLGGFAFTGAGNITKIGSGTLTIGGGGNSTNTGTFRVTQGTVVFNNGGGNSIGGNLLISGSTNPTTARLGISNQIADAATVELLTTGSNAHLFDINDFEETIGSLIVTSSTSAGAAVRTGASGVLTVLGDIYLNNDRSADSSTTEFQVLVTGTGTVTAGTRSTTGTLDLGGAVRRIVVDSIQTNMGFRNDAVVETVVRNGGITKEGTRALYLRAANTYSLATTINAGKIVVTSADNLGDGSATNVLNLNNGTLSAQATFDLGTRAVNLGYGGGFVEVTGAFALTVSGVISGDDCAALIKVGTGTMMLGANNAYLGTTQITAGTLAVGTGGTTGTLGAGAVVNSATLSFNRSDSFLVANAISGSGVVNQDGVGRTILSGLNTYTGVTTVINGTLQFAGPQALYGGVQGNWTATNLVVNSGATASFNVGGAGEFTAADVDAVKTIGSATGGFLTGSSLGFDTTNAAGGTFTYGTAIEDTNGGANAVGVTKLGLGTLQLTAVNTYTGITSVKAGTLSIASEANLGANPAAFNPAQLTLDGGTLATTASFTIDDANRGMTLGAAGGTLDVAAATSLGVATPIAGGGSLTKQGNGTLTFSGNVTHAYTGDTFVAAGNVNGDGTLNSRVVVQSGGQFSAGSNAAVGNAGDGVGQIALAAGTEWQGGSSLVFDFANTTGTAGTDWDFLNITGGLDVTAAGASRIHLYIDSWLADKSAYGVAGNFDINAPPTNGTTTPPNSYQWLWATASSGITLNGVAIPAGDVDLSEYFQVDADRIGTGAFAVYPGGNVGGQFWVSAVGTNLYINYSSVPEPGSMVLIGVAGLGFAAYRRRKRNQAEEK